MDFIHQDQRWMKQALLQATQCANEEVPVGAVLVFENQLIAENRNNCVKSSDPTAHAELLVLKEGLRSLKQPYLLKTTLYVTLEPCLMCLGAIIHLRVARIVFGAYDNKRNISGSSWHLLKTQGGDHIPDIIGGVASIKSRELLRDFFYRQRGKIASDVKR